MDKVQAMCRQTGLGSNETNRYFISGLRPHIKTTIINRRKNGSKEEAFQCARNTQYMSQGNTVCATQLITMSAQIDSVAAQQMVQFQNKQMEQFDATFDTLVVGVCLNATQQHKSTKLTIFARQKHFRFWGKPESRISAWTVQ